MSGTGTLGSNGSLRRFAILVNLVLTALGCDGASPFLEKERTPGRFLIPDSYVGWVQIDFGVSGAPPAPAEGEFLVFRVPNDGRLQTSTGFEVGVAQDRYFYYEGAIETRELAVSAWGDGGMIWAASTGDTQDGHARSPIHLRFFVGTEQQYRAYEAGASTYPPPIGPLAPAPQR